MYVYIYTENILNVLKCKYLSNRSTLYKYAVY